MLLTTLYDIWCTTVNLITEDLNRDVVEAVLLASACEEPAHIEIPLRGVNEPAVDCWLPFSRGFCMEPPPPDGSICNLILDEIPGVPNHKFAFRYTFYFFKQSTPNLPSNVCVGSFSRSRNAPSVHGDIVVIKHDLEDKVVNIQPREIDFIATIAALAANQRMFRLHSGE
ncbi:hypothetical protein BJ138DRAFT_1168594 [Hygrophoropsis aurantiaca]|uniref:Uncharacterized protein n=1 Tax=Hygrophoropsis aurantiaca TaxID=72124 RepID=A0ACB7ZQP1_9AGAM|nr:hypothetical protein BJ138DRAFT_1168594 [Hygrophoropsis aurantiaca]